MTKVTKLPRNVDLSNTRLHDSVWEGVNETLIAKFGAVPSSYGLEIKVVDIDWEEDFVGGNND